MAKYIQYDKLSWDKNISVKITDNNNHIYITDVCMFVYIQYFKKNYETTQVITKLTQSLSMYSIVTSSQHCYK